MTVAVIASVLAWLIVFAIGWHYCVRPFRIPKPRALMSRRLIALFALFLAAPLAAQDTTTIKRLTRQTRGLQDSIAKRSTSAIVDRQAALTKRLVDTIDIAARRVIARDTVIVRMTDTLRIVVHDTVLVATKPDTAPTPVPNPTPTPTPVPTPSPVPAPSGSVGPATVAELPRGVQRASVPTQLHAVKVCANACSLQAAMNAAKSGDELLLAPGATYPGNFIWPNKGAAQSWVVIRTDTTIVLGSTRMTPTAAAQNRLAKIAATSYAPAIETAQGAHHLWITGVEIVAAPVEMNPLVKLSDPAQTGPTLHANAPHHIVIDRSYVHGLPSASVRRCVLVNGADLEVRDSWLDECHTSNGDGNAVIGWVSTERVLIENNYLACSHECVMFGGSDVQDASFGPQDIILRGNHITRPLAWKGKWVAKNLLETKHVRRLLIEGNVFENNWVDGQVGFAFVLKSENQDGACTFCTSSDITVRGNLIRMSTNGFNIQATGSNNAPVIPAARITITDNVIEQLNAAPVAAGGAGIILQLLAGVSDVVFAHNTVQNPGTLNSVLTLSGAPAVLRFAAHSNLLAPTQYGVKGSNCNGGACLTQYTPGALFASNVLVGANVYPLSCTGFPATTLCPNALPATLPVGYDTRPIGADPSVLSLPSRVVIAP